MDSIDDESYNAYKARFSRVSLKKHEKLPKDIKTKHNCELSRHV